MFIERYSNYRMRESMVGAYTSAPTILIPSTNIIMQCW